MSAEEPPAPIVLARAIRAASDRDTATIAAGAEVFFQPAPRSAGTTATTVAERAAAAPCRSSTSTRSPARSRRESPGSASGTLTTRSVPLGVWRFRPISRRPLVTGSPADMGPSTRCPVSSPRAARSPGDKSSGHASTVRSAALSRCPAGTSRAATTTWRVGSGAGRNAVSPTTTAAPTSSAASSRRIRSCRHSLHRRVRRPSSVTAAGGVDRCRPRHDGMGRRRCCRAGRPGARRRCRARRP